MPELWDAVRRSVDEDASAGRFLLTGSAAPDALPETASNIDNGVGYLVGIVSKTIPFQCPLDVDG